MNIQNIKALSWVAALGMGGYLGYEVWHFLENRPVYQDYVRQDELEAVLRDGIEEPEEIRREVVDSKEIMAVFHKMDWTGKPEPVKPVVVQQKDTQVKRGPDRTPVEQLLEIQLVQVDKGNPENSLAIVKYLHKELKARHTAPGEKILKTGQALTGKFAHVSVKEIQPDGLVFTFDDEEREDELLESPVWVPSGPGIAYVTEETKQVRTANPRIPTLTNYRPTSVKETRQVNRDTWQIGTESARQIGESYSTILSRDIDYRVARDPRDGSVKGLQITKVAAGSVPAQHGVSSGEILKSINGHKVTSVSDAVSYVKRESDTTEEWIAVFEK